MIYTNKSINIISFILSCVIFFIINFCTSNISDIPDNPKETILNIISNIESIVDNKEEEKEKNVELGEWYIEIPSINLKAPIAEGTDMNTLNTKVGHFEDTASKQGNIGLAAHNRGYEYNFFKNLKKVKMDDEIIYTYKEYKKTYIVDKIEIIESSDWSYLDDTEENKITLITCVENEPQFRRCVQAIEL